MDTDRLNTQPCIACGQPISSHFTQGLRGIWIGCRAADDKPKLDPSALAFIAIHTALDTLRTCIESATELDEVHLIHSELRELEDELHTITTRCLARADELLR